MENQNKKPIMVEIGKEYKQMELDVYDYANFLQCSPELSCKTWEVQPFKLMERYIKEDLEYLVEKIMGQRLSVEEKCEKMKDYVEGVYRKFKRKVSTFLCRTRSRWSFSTTRPTRSSPTSRR